MVISTADGKLTYCCDICIQEFTVKIRKAMLTAETHKCRKCHARLYAKSGGAGAAKFYAEHPEIARENGKRLHEWSHTNGICRIGGLKAAAMGVVSRAGKIGGRKMASSGKLLEVGKLAHTPEAEAKRFKTRKARGLMFTSKPERSFFERLLETYPQTVHQTTIDRFSIDFYVPEIDTFVQFDGEYWHGLNTLPELLSGTPAEKYKRDRQCDEFCTNSNIRLIRITDRQFRELEWKSILERLQR